MSQRKEFWLRAKTECVATAGGICSSACWKRGNPTLHCHNATIPIRRTEVPFNREDASGLETIFISCSRDRALSGLLVSRNREEMLEAPPPTDACVPTQVSPGAEIHTAQQTFFFLVLHGIVLPMAPLLPSPRLFPPSGLCSRELKYSFDLMEDWHQCKPSVTQDFSQSLVLKSVYLLKTNVGIKVVRTLWPFK